MQVFVEGTLAYRTSANMSVQTAARGLILVNRRSPAKRRRDAQNAFATVLPAFTDVTAGKQTRLH